LRKKKVSPEYNTVAQIKKAVNIPVIANGDISCYEDAKRVLDFTGADGVMIGRAAQGNPWLFKSITEQLKGNSAPLPPTTKQIFETLTTHLNGLYELYGEYTGVRVARKHIAWYCKGIRNANEFRVRAYAAESSVEQLAIVKDFFTCPDLFVAAA